MSELDDHDPDKGKWIRPIEVDVGGVLHAWQQRQAREAAERLEAWRNSRADDNPNIIRGYN